MPSFSGFITHNIPSLKKIITFFINCVNNKNCEKGIKSTLFLLFESFFVIKMLGMKKFLISLLALFIICPAIADNNVMFGDKANSMTLYAAQSTGSGSLLKLVQPGIWEFYPQTLVMLQYAQPIKFFRLDSRLNLNIGQNFAYNSSRGLSFMGIGISVDTALLQYDGWYMGIGIGPFMRNRMDRWVESRLVFGEKFFIGKNISDNWYAEIFTIHFSNGNFTPRNEGFNFAGISVGYKF